MSKLKLIAPLTHAGNRMADDHYPRYLVISGMLAFCLASWALIILAVVHYG